MVTIILWSFIAYGMTTIIVYGSIFENFRNFLENRIKILYQLVSCPLCTSTWVGFFLSICLGGLTNEIFEINRVLSVFFDGMFTAGIVWAINSIIEFFEDFNDSNNTKNNDHILYS